MPTQNELYRQKIAQVQAQRLFDKFFFNHPEIADNQAVRKALVARAESLTGDNGLITFELLNDAAQLLVNEGVIRVQRVLAAAERKEQEVKDREVFAAAARKHGLADNEANFRLLVEVIGPGLDEYKIAQVVKSDAVQLAPVGQEEQQQRDDDEREELLEEIIGGRILSKTDQLRFQAMTSEQLRTAVAQLREERRLRNLTPTEIRNHLRQQHSSQAATPTATDLDEMSRDNILLSIEAAEKEKQGGGVEYLRSLVRRTGFDAINRKLNDGFVKPEILGIVRRVVHPFDQIES